MRVFSHFDFAVPVISSSSDESCLTPSTSDESCSDSGSLSLLRERNKPHYWTEEQRRVLCVLERWFYSFSYKRVGQLTPSDRKRVFCAYFYDEFHGDTNPKTISENATLAQILKIKSHGAANEAWRKVYLETKFDDPGGVWEYSKQELLAVAKDLNIDIRLKTTEDTTAVLKGAKLSARRKRRQPRDDWSTTDESDWDISTDELDQEVTLPNRKRRLYRVSRQGAGTPNSSKSLNKTKPVARSRSDRSDKIGYRWFADESTQGINSLSGFRAGRFLQGAIDPPECDPKAFGELCYLHLRPLHEPSPFVSIACNFRPAFRKAVCSPGTAHIAIIDIEFLRKRRIAGREVLFEAGKVAKHYGIKGYSWENGLEYDYDYRYEYIVWGEIPQEAILGGFSMADFHRHASSPSLATIQLQDILSVDRCRTARNAGQLMRYLRSTTIIADDQTGARVGEFLAWAGLDRAAAVTVANNIATKFFFYNASRRGENPYVRGVEDGHYRYTEALARLTQYSTPVRRGYRSPSPASLPSTPSLSSLDSASASPWPLSQMYSTVEDEFAARRLSIQLMLRSPLWSG